MTGWRALGAFWAVILVGLLGGAAALQAIGPAPVHSSARPVAPVDISPKPVMIEPSVSRPDGPNQAAPTPVAPAPANSPNPISVPASMPAPTPVPDVRPPGRPGPIAAPDPALLEPSPVSLDVQRPRIAADGRTSMAVYARFVDPLDKRPRVAMVIVGLGMSSVESGAAITALPGGITLGFSPYSAHPETLLKEARARGHEILVTLPMESQGYPLNQSGARALLTGSDPAANDANLQWVLSRMQGEVGLTGASDGLRGERFASATVPFDVMLGELANRGLLYVDPRVDSHPEIPLKGSAISVTLIVDDPPTRADIDAKLAALEVQARDNGAAVGLAGRLLPITVDRVAAWARGLDARGIDLVPISALIVPHLP